MTSRITIRRSVQMIFLILGLMSVVHALILIGVIPWTVVWGGRLESVGQMRLFEAIALIATLFMLWVAAMRGAFIKVVLPPWLLTAFLWLIAIYFLLNTVGNLLSKNRIEQFVFTPLALILAGLYFRLTQKDVVSP